MEGKMPGFDKIAETVRGMGFVSITLNFSSVMQEYVILETLHDAFLGEKCSAWKREHIQNNNLLIILYFRILI